MSMPMSNVAKSKNLSELSVNTISLVSDKETPAVPKASTKFSIMKMFVKKKTATYTDDQMDTLSKIQAKYK